MKSIDIKSLLIGILGTALVMVLMGQSSLKKQYDVECITYKNGENIQCKRFNVNSGVWGLGNTFMFDWRSFYDHDVQ